MQLHPRITRTLPRGGDRQALSLVNTPRTHSGEHKAFGISHLAKAARKQTNETLVEEKKASKAQKAGSTATKVAGPSAHIHTRTRVQQCHAPAAVQSLAAYAALYYTSVHLALHRSPSKPTV